LSEGQRLRELDEEALRDNNGVKMDNITVEGNYKMKNSRFILFTCI
jgi:hypothetical protein